MDQVAPEETVDRLLMYRNLLCAEDHLDEMIVTATTADESSRLKDIKSAIENIRSDVGFVEYDKRYHCLTKHLSVAYEAAREVAKATHSESDFARAEVLRFYMLFALEKLLGAKIHNCSRCGMAGEAQSD